jgi:hypothetical protein
MPLNRKQTGICLKLNAVDKLPEISSDANNEFIFPQSEYLGLGNQPAMWI